MIDTDILKLMNELQEKLPLVSMSWSEKDRDHLTYNLVADLKGTMLTVIAYGQKLEYFAFRN